MRYPLLKPIAVFLSMHAAGFACAGPIDGIVAEYENVRAKGKVAHVLDIDNDTLLLNRDDGFYTSGLRYTHVTSLRDGGAATCFGWRFGQELYTASDIKLAPEFVVPPNHPYAGWLYGGFFREVQHPDGTHAKVGIDVGCLGPCAGGEWTQTQFHKVLNQPLPRGWSRQVKNEAGIVLYGEMSPVRWTPHASIDVTPVLSARFGNIFTDASVSLLARAGQLNSSPTGSALYAYVRAEARAVGYNATLQGGYFTNDNPHTVDPKRFTGNAEAGLAWSHGLFAATLALVRRGNEIRDLSNSVGAQNYLRLQFSYSP